jgi:lipid-A-disaccharide synthase-like uncharacterized protein
MLELEAVTYTYMNNMGVLLVTMIVLIVLMVIAFFASDDDNQKVMAVLFGVMGILGLVQVSFIMNNNKKYLDTEVINYPLSTVTYNPHKYMFVEKNTNAPYYIVNKKKGDKVASYELYCSKEYLNQMLNK